MVTNRFGFVMKLVLLFVKIALSSVQIEELIVPETVAVDSEVAIIKCVYSGLSDYFNVRWLFNEIQIFEWNSTMEQPQVKAILDSRIDASSNSKTRQVLRLSNLRPELSGLYTCTVWTDGMEARQSKDMIVYSTEREFQLLVEKGKLKCITKGIYPQPDLTIEFNNYRIAQQQRIWRNGSFYDAECVAVIPSAVYKYGDIACRLQIPQVDYTAIIKKNLNLEMNAANRILVPTIFSVLFCTTIIM